MTDLRPTLERAIAEASVDELPSLAGVLEEAHTRILARLVARAPEKTARPAQHMLVEEVAALLKFEVPYTYALARRGVFGPVLREGKYVRITQAGFDQYLHRSQESAYIHRRERR